MKAPYFLRYGGSGSIGNIQRLRDLNVRTLVCGTYGMGDRTGCEKPLLEACNMHSFTEEMAQNAPPRI